MVNFVSSQETDNLPSKHLGVKCQVIREDSGKLNNVNTFDEQSFFADIYSSDPLQYSYLVVGKKLLSRLESPQK